MAPVPGRERVPLGVDRYPGIPSGLSRSCREPSSCVYDGLTLVYCQALTPLRVDYPVNKGPASGRISRSRRVRGGFPSRRTLGRGPRDAAMSETQGFRSVARGKRRARRDSDPQPAASKADAPRPCISSIFRSEPLYLGYLSSVSFVSPRRWILYHLSRFGKRISPHISLRPWWATSAPA